jgi:hypothetical protein
MRGQRSPLGLRTAAAVLVGLAAVIAIALWPRARTPDSPPAPTPTLAPAATLLEPDVTARFGASGLSSASALSPASAVSGAFGTAFDAPFSTAVTPESEAPSPGRPIVRFVNPFDSGEVFEFPPGTPYVEARDEVAQRLITRARERIGTRNSSTPNTNTTPERQQATTSRASFARQL